MSDDNFELRRLKLEELKHNSLLELSRARLEIERVQAGKFSSGSVAIISAAIALLTALVTAFLQGHGDLSIQRAQAKAESDRLSQKLRFDIILQATRGEPPEIVVLPH